MMIKQFRRDKNVEIYICETLKRKKKCLITDFNRLENDHKTVLIFSMFDMMAFGIEYN